MVSRTFKPIAPAGKGGGGGVGVGTGVGVGVGLGPGVPVPALELPHDHDPAIEIANKTTHSLSIGMDRFFPDLIMHHSLTTT
ncbi:MAG: hypothetical protein ACHP79_03265 [Terriglobales bacterium]